MRRTLTTPLALVAGLALFLAGCAGESPTQPKTDNGGGGTPGTCNVSVALQVSSVTPLAGSGIIVRAIVTKNGAVVPDGTSVFFTTDFGAFLETGLPSVSKVVQNGYAEVVLASLSAGNSNISASLECGKATRTIQWQPVPIQGPYVASISPGSGSCAGGEEVVLQGGRFGTNVDAVRVLFGTARATIVSVSENSIVVRTPARSLADPKVPETVDVLVVINPGEAGEVKAAIVKFTYYCVERRATISSVNPNFGTPDGGETVTVFGNNFVGSAATTRVTFGGIPASITGFGESEITVRTPRYTLKDQRASETVDVVVTVDLGKVSEQEARLAQAFTYRYPATPIVTSVAPSTGSTDGGQNVTIRGSNFGSILSTTRVLFGNVQATVEAVSDTAINVVTPRWTLKSPGVSETVDVTVVIDAGLMTEKLATLSRAYTFVPPQGISVSAVSPKLGSPDGNEAVTITGTGFGSDIAKARVTFGTAQASISVMSDTSILVTTPKYVLKDPAVSETVTVTVTINMGLPTERSAALPNSFTFRATATVVTSINPNVGSPDGNQLVTINGNGFGSEVSRVRVSFGTAPASVQAVNDTSIQVLTPRWTLANPRIPEIVDVKVTIDVGLPSERQSTLIKAFMFRAPNLTVISSLSPNVGSPAGGELVTLFGNNFGTDVTATRVTFGLLQASVQSVSQNTITVLSPRWTLRDPQVSETVDVTVTANRASPDEQTASLPRAFTYRGSGPTVPCNTDPRLFITSVAPGSGPASGGDIVSIQGGGFGTVVATTRVEFGGSPATILSVSDGLISVATPRRTLTNPDSPESVDLVVTIDVGGPNQACARMANAYSYTPQILDPVIYSISPNSGPNDQPTRVSIFGANFQFPMQVFVESAACRVEASVVEITPTRIIFLTPIAANANVCLANSTVTVDVVNPATGRRATSPESFRYFACPTAVSASPSLVPYNTTSNVSIYGNNFEEPIEATFTADNGVGFRLNVVSVSAGLVVLQMPPIDPLQFYLSGLSCVNIGGSITLRSLSINCAPVSVAMSYRIDQMRIISLTPNAVSQDGGTTVAVAGEYFQDPIVVDIMRGGVVYGTVNATITNSGALTFVAPAIPNTAFDSTAQACTLNGTVSGQRWVPTAFDVRVRSSRTACIATLSNGLIYNPKDTSCRGLILAETAPTAANLCAPYSFTFQATGGKTPYTYSVASGALPAGLSLNPATGQVSGTPQLSTANAGVATQNIALRIRVTDSSDPAQSTQRDYTLTLNDPNAPFTIQGSTNQTVPSTGGTTATFTALPNPTPISPHNFTPVTWAISNLTSLPAGFALSSQTGQTTAITVGPSVAAGNYSVILQANDNACGTVRHQATFTVNVTKLGPQQGNLEITTPTLADATICSPYSQTMAASGGVPPYNWTLSGALPSGLSISQTTGEISGTPLVPGGLAGQNPGQSTASTQITITVRDSSSTQLTAQRTYTFRLNDPAAPFTITGNAVQSIPTTGGSGDLLTVTPATPSNFSPVNWSVASVPVPAAGGFSMTPTSGQSSRISALAGTTPGTYAVTVSAEDSPVCSGPPNQPVRHRNQYVVTLTVTP